MGMYAAYVFFGLRKTGEYLLPVPGLPGFLKVGPSTGMALAPSLAIALVTAAVLGLLVHLLVFRPLRQAPTLAKVAASIGLMLALQSIVAYRFGTETLSVPAILPKGTAFTMSGIHFPIDRFIIAAIAVVVAVGLWAVFRYSRFGLATRAAAENERGAMLLGFSPDVQAGTIWVLATVLAAVGGILVAPITDLTPTGFTLLVIPALAAGLIARFTSFGATVTAALAIGVMQNELTNLPNKVHWLPTVGLPESFPFVVIIVVMFVVGKSLPDRGAASEGKLAAVPASHRRVIAPAVAFAVVVVLLYSVSALYRGALINSMIGAIICLSLVVITGFVAQISLLQMALAGVAGYLLSHLTSRLGIPFPISPLLAVAGATLVGLVAALPALRVRGVNLAVVTLAGGYAIERVVFNNPSLNGGFKGAHVVAPTVFGVKLALSKGHTIAQPVFGVFILIVLTGVALGVNNLRRSATGRRLLAVRTNERAAASMGIDVARTKLLAFAVASMLAGVAGCLIGYQQSILSGDSFGALVSISFLAIAFLGGITTVVGAMVAGALVAGGLSPVLLDSLIFSRSANGAALQDLIGGVGLILTAILNPIGIAGGVRLTIDQFKGKRSRPHSAGQDDQAAPAVPSVESPVVHAAVEV
jgi:branched-chain amino acid transport system permease protein